ncbi:hypothetical protein VPH35_083387 [Triticum aestivum]|uniref:Prolamin-like domain-containing protein n=1 Tax=Triticum aestivum TaxID=4565 RepID=A0A3B6KJ85_WHEAT|nr:uncharacterized protein LOC123107062 [Triticum aestivum]
MASSQSFYLQHISHSSQEPESNMSRPFPPLFVTLVLLLLTSTSSPATAAAEIAEAPSAVGCSGSAEAASRVVAESCTDDIVRSFFGVRGSDLCCRALETAGAGCYRAAFSGSPFADIYPTILGNVCGLAVAPSPGERSYY